MAPPHPPSQLVNFAVRHKMDYVAASFVQSGDDVRCATPAATAALSLPDLQPDVNLLALSDAHCSLLTS